MRSPPNGGELGGAICGLGPGGGTVGAERAEGRRAGGTTFGDREGTTAARSPEATGSEAAGSEAAGSAGSKAAGSAGSKAAGSGSAGGS